jgi:glutathione S-transferase
MSESQTALLYHAPLTCSLAARFCAAEAGVDIQLQPLNLLNKTLVGNGVVGAPSYLGIHPLGQVSALRTANGEFITETAVVLMWLQHQSRQTDFKRDVDHTEYFQLLRWLNFCATELHKQIFRIVFYQEATDPVKAKIRDLAPPRLALLDQHLSDRSFLLGDTFSAADAYLTWFFVLSDRAQLNLEPYQQLCDYRQRVLARPLIQQLIADDLTMDVAIGQNIQSSL